jgi:hypothetical protein
MSNEVEIFANFLIDSDGEGKIEIWDYEKTCLLNLLQYPLNGKNIITQFNSGKGILAAGSNEIILWK